MRPGEIEGKYAMLEIEMKFPVASFGAVQALLDSWQAAPESPHVEADHYYNAPDRDFARTDEALRLRRIGPASLLTYKGPRQPGPTKTRTEIEVPLQQTDAATRDCLRLLEHLGYRATAVVRKVRRQFSLDRSGFTLHVCLDEVEELGLFVEVEIVTTPEGRDAAQQVLQTVAAAMGLSNPEPRSYLHLLLEKRSATS